MHSNCMHTGRTRISIASSLYPQQRSAQLQEFVLLSKQPCTVTCILCDTALPGGVSSRDARRGTFKRVLLTLSLTGPVSRVIPPTNFHISYHISCDSCLEAYHQTFPYTPRTFVFCSQCSIRDTSWLHNVVPGVHLLLPAAAIDHFQPRQTMQY